jgi:hypothetical protein
MRFEAYHTLARDASSCELMFSSLSTTERVSNERWLATPMVDERTFGVGESLDAQLCLQ